VSADQKAENAALAALLAAAACLPWSRRGVKLFAALLRRRKQRLTMVPSTSGRTLPSPSAPAAAESAEEKLYATEAPAAAAPADPLPAPPAEAGSGETRMSVCAAANGAATLGAASALADLAVDTEAGIPEVPGRAPDRTAELPEGCLEIWDEGETMVCRLGDWVFVPADPADILALLEG
jgi:hypothetical protein